MRYEYCRQDVFRGEAPPCGDGWEPFAAMCYVASLKVDEPEAAMGEVVWWRRRVLEGWRLRLDQAHGLVAVMWEALWAPKDSFDTF